MLRILGIVFFFILGTFSRPILERVKRNPRLDPDRYLERFGYIMSGGLGGPASNEARSEGIRQFQKMAGLQETGFLNNVTMTWMIKPRCGLPDRIPEGGAMDELPDGAVIAQAYQVPGSKWTKKRLTYSIHNYSPDLDMGTQRRAFYNAFKHWSDVSNLEFRALNDRSTVADINILFSYGEHGDGSYNAFDGKGGILAHAFFPESGQTHFDESEDWTDGEDRGSNLEIVAAHELGHALGLAHSQVGDSLMAPFYTYNPDFQLHPDDIAGIQTLYGAKQQPRTTMRPVRPTRPTPRPTPSHPPPTPRPTPRRPRPTPSQPRTTTSRPRPTTRRPRPTPSRPKPKPGTHPDPCTTKFDAVFLGPNRKTYMLKSKSVFRLGTRGVETGYPKFAKEIFSGKVPINVGGATFSKRTQRLYFFKGKRVWRYQFNANDEKFTIDAGFPRKISNPQYPDAVDAALSDNNGHIYLFRRGFSYSFSEYYLTVDRAAPRAIGSRFTAIPNNVEAAVRLADGYMYFFKGTNYRKYLDGLGVVSGPKAKAGPWMACGGYKPK